MIVLDTHAWIWWVNDPASIPQKSQDWIQKAVEKKSVLISSISMWEISMLVKKKRLQLSLDVNDWVAKCETLPFFQFIPMTNRIALRSFDLPGFDYPDPADRIIIATALSTNSVLITKDERIQKYKNVQTAWE